MKTMLKYFAAMSLVFVMGTAMAQHSETDRLANAVEELYELREMDKSLMTKAEKKAWKARKRALRQIINIEQERLAAQQFHANPWRYSPYGSPAFGVWGNPYRGWYGPRQRVVVVRPQQQCVVPAPQAQTRVQNRPQARRPRTPSNVRRR